MPVGGRGRAGPPVGLAPRVMEVADLAFLPHLVPEYGLPQWWDLGLGAACS